MTRWLVLIGDDQLSPRVTAPWAGLKPAQVAHRAAAYAAPGERLTVSDSDGCACHEYIVRHPGGAGRRRGR